MIVNGVLWNSERKILSVWKYVLLEAKGEVAIIVKMKNKVDTTKYRCTPKLI